MEKKGLGKDGIPLLACHHLPVSFSPHILLEGGEAGKGVWGSLARVEKREGGKLEGGEGILEEGVVCVFRNGKRSVVKGGEGEKEFFEGFIGERMGVVRAGGVRKVEGEEWEALERGVGECLERDGVEKRFGKGDGGWVRDFIPGMELVEYVQRWRDRGCSGYYFFFLFFVTKLNLIFFFFFFLRPLFSSPLLCEIGQIVALSLFCRNPSIIPFFFDHNNINYNLLFASPLKVKQSGSALSQKGEEEEFHVVSLLLSPKEERQELTINEANRLVKEALSFPTTESLSSSPISEPPFPSFLSLRKRIFSDFSFDIGSLFFFLSIPIFLLPIKKDFTDLLFRKKRGGGSSNRLSLRPSFFDGRGGDWS